MSGDYDNSSLSHAIRAIKAQALREAAQAYAGDDPVIVEFLLFRADEIEVGDRS